MISLKEINQTFPWNIAYSVQTKIFDDFLFWQKIQLYTLISSHQNLAIVILEMYFLKKETYSYIPKYNIYYRVDKLLA